MYVHMYTYMPDLVIYILYFQSEGVQFNMDGNIESLRGTVTVGSTICWNLNSGFWMLDSGMWILE